MTSLATQLLFVHSVLHVEARAVVDLVPDYHEGRLFLFIFFLNVDNHVFSRIFCV